MQLSARSVVEGTTTGAHRSPVKGASIEFRQHRIYVPGDEPRRLDWRVLARMDRPYIREYDEETNLRCMILLDCSGSMAFGPAGGTKFDYACRVLASLAYLMLGQTESVGLATTGGATEHWLAPRAGTAQLSRIIETLERSAPRGPSDLPAALHRSADRLDRRALVVVLSDCFAPIPPIRTGLTHLRHDHHELLVVRVLDRAEIAFPFRGWSRFRGLEGERPHLCEPATVRRIYLDNFERHGAALRSTCRLTGTEFHEFVTDTPLIDSLTTLLRRRRK